MKSIINKLLGTYEFEGIGDFLYSLAPSFKYHMVILMFSFSAFSTCIQEIFGIDIVALIALIVVLAVEVWSGIKASKVKQQPFSSVRFSRFLLKFCCYMSVLFFVYRLQVMYQVQGRTVLQSLYQWLHTYLMVHIAVENIISILENKAVIEGKPKPFYIDKIRDKFKDV